MAQGTRNIVYAGFMKKILIVDDSLESLVYITMQLDKIMPNCSYLVTTSPKEALELFKVFRNSISLIVTDNMMPGISGCELAEKCKQLKSDVPILLVTAYAGDVDEANIEGLLSKPVSALTLAEATNMAMNSTCLLTDRTQVGETANSILKTLSDIKDSLK